MARVRSRSGGADGLWPDDAPGRRGLDSELRRSLQQARALAGSLRVDYQLGWRTPVIGHAWLVVRRRIHQEIRIYIDALTRQQTAFNSTVVQALGRLVEHSRGLASSAEVAELRSQSTDGAGRP